MTRGLKPSARPLVIVFMVPLAASCLMAGPMGIGVREAALRTAEVSLLQDRLREFFAAVSEEARADDPPARASRWAGEGAGAAACLAAPVDGVFPIQPGTSGFLGQTSETFLNAPRAGAHPRRGPPVLAT